MHDFNGHIIRDGTLFSNAAMKGCAEAKSRIIDYYVTVNDDSGAWTGERTVRHDMISSQNDVSSSLQ